MGDTKYVILNEVKTQYGEAFEVPIIFPDVLTHEIVANHFGGKANVVSAGFVAVGSDMDYKMRYGTYGESVSLGVKSRGERDDKIVRRVFEEY